jgi:pilus assembly protein Flp/PilA
MLEYIRRLSVAKLNADEGASAVEYGLLVAAIAAIIILVVFAVGSWVKGAFKDTCDAFSSAGSVTRAGAASTQSCNS